MILPVSHSTAPRLRRIAAGVWTLLVCSGCASWHTLDAPPQTLMEGERPTKVRVTHEDGTRVVLTRPRVLGDVLAGFEADCVERWGQDEARCPETGIPVYQIEQLEVERVGAGSLLLPAAGGLLLAWLLANR